MMMELIRKDKHSWTLNASRFFVLQSTMLSFRLMWKTRREILNITESRKLIPNVIILIMYCYFYRQCALHVHPIQNEIQDLGNAIVRVKDLV